MISIIVATDDDLLIGKKTLLMECLGIIKKIYNILKNNTSSNNFNGKNNIHGNRKTTSS